MSRADHDVVVIGAGLFGLVFARRLAERTQARVLVVEATDHLGGLSWSRRDPVTGVEYGPQGTHVLAVADQRVREYLTRFTALVDYRHAVFAQPGPVGTGDRLVAMPVGLEALSYCYGTDLNAEQARRLIERETAAYRDRPERSVADAALAALGPRLFTMFVAGYVEKQWGLAPDLLQAAAFTTRFEIRYERTSTYFPPERWQGLPAGGYADLCTALAAHERIDVELGRDGLGDPRPRFQHLCLVTSPIDAYLGYRFGPLARREITIDWRHVDTADAPSAACVTYPDPTVAYYRTHVPALLAWNTPPPTAQDKVLVGFERAGTGEHTTSFVVRSPANADLAKRYHLAGARLRRHLFAGRGATFYDDMATTVAAALNAADDALPRLGELGR